MIKLIEFSKEDNIINLIFKSNSIKLFLYYILIN